MPLKTIYLTRHGFRSNWVVDSKTGTYTASIPSPTNIPSDPALAGYGVSQSHELAAHLAALDPAIQRVYSSPFYRCIQTIAPTIALINSPEPLATTDAVSTIQKNRSDNVQVRLENGVGEWYGTARFDHPSPASPNLLSSLFPNGLIDLNYQPIIVPSTNGETIRELHDRSAYALHQIIKDCDEDGIEAICICTHAATLIAIGRALVGRMPEHIEEEDFRPFTCGLSVFTRKSVAMVKDLQTWKDPSDSIPSIEWQNGNGVGGGWELELSGDCSFLSGGEERGWRFSGDESFHSSKDEAAGLDAGSGLGVVIEGRKGDTKGRRSPSRL